MVRHPTSADIADLARIHVEAWKDAYAGLLPDVTIAAMTLERRTEMWRRVLASDEQRAWVAEIDSDVIGLASVGPARDPAGWGQLYNIYVVARAWGTGAGSALWDAAQEGLTDMGYQNRQLYVLDTNERARRFYEHKHWVHDGIVLMDDSFGDPIRELRYVPA